MPLLLLCGIPGAGKTTIASQIMKHFGGMKFSFDDFVTSKLEASMNFAESSVIDESLPSSSNVPEIQEDEILQPSKIYRKLWEQSIESFLQQELETSTSNNPENGGSPMIILDDNYYLQSQRRSIIKIAKRFGLKCCCIKMVINVEQAQYRNDQRNGKTRETDIERMFEALKIDSEMIQRMDERFEDSGIDFFFDSNVTGFNDLCGFIESFMKTHPDEFALPSFQATSPPSSTVAAKLSFIQGIDSLSRRIANTLIISGYQQHGEAINAFRRMFMDELRRNETLLGLNQDNVKCAYNKSYIQGYLEGCMNAFGLINE